MAESNEERSRVLFLRPSPELITRLDAYVAAQNDGQEYGKRSRNVVACELLDRALRDVSRDRKGKR